MATSGGLWGGRHADSSDKHRHSQALGTLEGTHASHSLGCARAVTPYCIYLFHEQKQLQTITVIVCVVTRKRKTQYFCMKICILEFACMMALELCGVPWFWCSCSPERRRMRRLDRTTPAAPPPDGRALNDSLPR